MELTRRQDGSKNSWISDAGESTEQDLEMEGGKTLLVTQIGKESFWLRLLMMMASIFPVYPTSKSRWKWTQIRWTVYPALFVLFMLEILVQNIIVISHNSKFKVSHQNETIGNQTEEYTVEMKVQWAATRWRILFCIQALQLYHSLENLLSTLSHKNYSDGLGKWLAIASSRFSPSTRYTNVSHLRFVRLDRWSGTFCSISISP